MVYNVYVWFNVHVWFFPAHVHAGSRERKWFEVQQAVDTLRSRQNYAKLDYFELACRTARNRDIKTAVFVDSFYPQTIT